MATRVLVVEDDATVSEVVSAYLSREGYECAVAVDGPSAERTWTQWQPDLVVLDVMIPGVSGLEVLRRRRAEDDATPVVILSARNDAEDRVIGLEFGADDYLVKPFSPRELVLRVAGLLRRRGRDEVRAGEPLPPITRGGLTIDQAGRRALLHGHELQLTHREFDLLAYLATYPGRAFSKQELLRRVWGWDFGDTSTVTVHIRRVREKLERDPSDPKLVLTVRGAGYRFTDESAEPSAVSHPGSPDA